MTPDDSASSIDLEPNAPSASYALRLGEGQEYAEFEPSLWRLTVFHVLGVSRQVSMGYAEVYLLEYFAKNYGVVISRQELLDHAWGDRVVSQGSLNQAISNLRSLLGDDQKREIITTVPRRGYQFSPDALMDWQEWLALKNEILSPAKLGTVPPASPLRQTLPLTAQSHWHLPTLWTIIGLLFLTLVAGVSSNFYYSLFPPYVSIDVITDNTQATLLASDKADLDEAQALIQPFLKRLDALGGARTLINLTENHLEFNCFRDDGTVHILLVDIARTQSLDDTYLKGCVK